MSARGGVDLGGTKVQAVVLGDDDAVLGSAKLPTPTTGGPADVAATMAQALAEAAQEAGIATEQLAGVGVGSPGSVDDDAGTVARAGNLPGWTDPFPLRDVLAEAAGTMVRLGNDVQVATDAEVALGAARDRSSLLGVFWGTGVGGGIVLNGQPLLTPAAGEIGHIVIVMGGRRCPCGRRGCLEAYAGRGSMERRARKRHEEGEPTDLFAIMQRRGRDRLSSGVWHRALQEGDELAQQIVDEAIEALGAGIASAVNLLGVELVVIGGGMGVRLGEPYVRRIEEAMMPHLFNDESPPTVSVAGLGDLGGAIGAALLVER